jgi:hypothetical protein
VGLPDDGPGLGAVRDEPPVALGEARQALQGLGAQRGGGAQGQEPDHRAHPHRQPAPIRRRQYVVEEAVVVVPQALVVRGGGDEREVLEELRGDVLVRRVVAGEHQRDLEQVQAVHRHPRGAVALLEHAGHG